MEGSLASEMWRRGESSNSSSSMSNDFVNRMLDEDALKEGGRVSSVLLGGIGRRRRTGDAAHREKQENGRSTFGGKSTTTRAREVKRSRASLSVRRRSESALPCEEKRSVEVRRRWRKNLLLPLPLPSAPLSSFASSQHRMIRTLLRTGKIGRGVSLGSARQPTRYRLLEELSPQKRRASGSERDGPCVWKAADTQYVLAHSLEVVTDSLIPQFPEPRRHQVRWFNDEQLCRRARPRSTEPLAGRRTLYPSL